MTNMDIDEPTGAGDRHRSTANKTRDKYTIDVLNNGHKLPLTCVCIDSNARYAYSASKCGKIVKWCMKTKKILSTVHGRSKNDQSSQMIKQHHNRHINCLALSSDDQYLVSGGYDKLIRVWNPNLLSLLHVFKGHLGEITGLVFRQNSHHLYSSGSDKSVKIWVMEEEPWSYVETLFGHESSVTSIDALDKERILTSGGRDETLRIWKIVEESQSVFQSSHKSADIVKFIDDKHFVSGGEDGNISVWSTTKRKPITTVSHATTNSEAGAAAPWVTSIATFGPEKSLITDDAHKGYTIASGSSDGKLNIWKSNSDESKKLDLVQSIPINGFINSLVFTKDGSKIVAAVGQEHKFGRWWRVKGSKNAVYVVTLRNKS